MSIQTINVGSSANDGTGDSARTAGQKINSNFSYIQDELDALAGSARKRAVINIVDNTAAPPTEVSGDRYIIDDTGSSHANWDGASALSIVEFDGTTWQEATPEEGWVVYVDTLNLDYRYVDDGTAQWEKVANGAIEYLTFAVSDETTDLTTGTAKLTFRMPYAFTLTEVRSSVNTAPTGSTLIVDINESGSTILSTKLSIDATEKTSTTAATPAVISDSSLADDAEITIDIDQVGSTVAGTGLKVTLIGTRT